MKKFFASSMIVAAAAMSFVSCNKETPVSEEISGAKIKTNVVATCPESKITINPKDGTTYPVTWDATGESLELVEVANSAFKAYSSSDYTLSTGNTSASFSFELTSVSADNYDYYFVSPASAYNAYYVNYSDFIVTLPKVQTSGVATVDPAAALIYGESENHSTQATEISTSFSHIASYVKLTLRNLPAGTGEKVKNVTFSASGKEVSGKVYYYVAGDDKGTIKKVSATSVNDDVVVSPAGEDVDATAEFTVWFSVLPFELAADDVLTIAVTTDVETYTREITMTADKSFVPGRIAVIPVNMETAVKPVDLSGNYVVLAPMGDGYEALTNVPTSTSTVRMTAQAFDYDGSESVSISDPKIFWTVAKSGSNYVMTSGGKYLSWTSGNAANMSDTPYALTIKESAEGTYNIASVAEATRILARNATAANNYFAFYTGSGFNELLLVPAELGSDPIINPISNPETVDAAGDVVTVNYFITNPASGKSVSASSDQTWVNSFDYSVAGEISFVVDENATDAARTATVTVSYPGAESVTFTVSQKCVAPELDGTYVILVKSGTNWFAMTNVDDGATTKRLKSASFTYSGTGSVETGDPSIIWTVAATDDGYSIVDNEGNYVSYGGSGNSMILSNTAYDLAIAPNTDGTYKISSVAIPGRVLAKNTNSAYFAFYGGTQLKDIYLVPAEVSTDPIIKPIANPAAVAAAGATTSVDYTITNPVAGQSVSASSDQAWVNSFDYSTAGKISFKVDENTTTEERTATVTVSYTGATSVTFTVSQNGKSDPSVKKLVLSFPDDNKDNNKLGSYTDTWTAKSGDSSWSVFGFNNNQWNWSNIRCGRKSDPSTATITNDAAISAAVKTVKLTIDDVVADKVNSIKLYVSADQTFTSGVQTIAIDSISAGTHTFTVPTPTANCFYKLEFDCIKHGSKNGFVQVSSIEYNWE